MLDPLVGWGLMIVGVLLMIAELLAPGRTYLAAPGSFLVALGSVAVISHSEGFTFQWGILIAVVVSVVVVVLTYIRYSMLGRASPRRGEAASLVGKKGKAVKRITAEGSSGRVRIGKNQWRAKSDETIEPGKAVEVVDMKGIYLIVVKADSRLKDEEE
jgi:membrane protein implicated in regulation of membrane protease activity